MLKGHQAPVHAVSLSHDNALAATGASDWTLKIWDVDTPKTRFTLDTDQNSVTALAFDHDSPLLVAADNSGRLTLYNALSGATVRTFGGLEGALSVMCPHCRRLLALPSGLLGSEGLCPHCRKSFTAGPYSPDKSEAAFKLAMEAMHAGTLERAVSLFDEAFAHQCDNSEACLRAMSCRFRMADDLAASKEHSGAVTHLQAALDMYQAGRPWPTEHTAESRKLAYDIAFLAAKVCRSGLGDPSRARTFGSVARDIQRTPEILDLLAHLSNSDRPA